MRRVVLIAGPPGAGKTTRARQLGLRVLDLDDVEWAGDDRRFRAALAALGRDRSADAVVIRSCATASAWRKTAALVGATSTELLNPGPDVCRRRITADSGRDYVARTWSSVGSRLAGVTTWYSAHAADPWQPARQPAAAPTPSRKW